MRGHAVLIIINNNINVWSGIVLPTKTQATPYPDRLFDNMLTGYAPTLGWWELTLSPHKLAETIEQANSRHKGLIRNSRERRLRNA
jgi:hypothetical protein